MTVHRTHSVAETETWAEALGRSCPPGLVLGLSGDLGAGKTAFVRGLARGLGCTSRVHSPTFALLHEYGGGRLRLFHLDLYRLGSPEEVRSAGLEEYLVQPDGVSVVEWVELRWCGDAPASAGDGTGLLRRIHFRTVDEHTRDLCYDHAGA